MSSQVTATAEAPALTARPRSAPRRRNMTPYALLAPTVVFLAVFFAWPMIQALVLAFQDANGAWSLAPFQRMTGDLNFGDAVKITLIFAALVIPLQTLFALGMALLKRMTGDLNFGDAVKITLIFAALVLPLPTLFAFGIALLQRMTGDLNFGDAVKIT